MEVQQHSRVYLSEDRRHSNNFVQKVMDDFLAHFKIIMEEQAAGVEAAESTVMPSGVLEMAMAAAAVQV